MRWAVALVVIAAIAVLAALWLSMGDDAPAAESATSAAVAGAARGGGVAERPVAVTEILERQPAPEEAAAAPAPTAGGEAPVMWAVRYRIVDDRGHPIEGASVRLDSYLPGEADRVEQTDASGVCAFELTAHPKPPRPEFVRASAWITRTGFADARDSLECQMFTTTGGTAERRVALQPGGTITVSVTDEAGSRVGSAVVLFHLDRTKAPSGPDGILPTTVPHYRCVTDAGGVAKLEGVQLGAWSAQAGNWRDWEGSETEEFTVEPGAAADLRLTVERWTHESYVSGRIADRAFSGDGGDVSHAFYLRNRDNLRRTEGVFDDGSFFVQLPSDLPEPWELVRTDGVVCSAPLSLVNGAHSLTIESACPDGR